MATRDGEEPKDESYRLDAQLISDLWIFRWAARFSSFTGAADRLNVTQGAVSQRITRLEGRLGTLLFHRTRRGLTRTDAGAGVYQAMNEVAATLNRTLSRFDRVQRRSLVISCMPSLATEWLVPHVDGFYAEHPDVELFIRAELLSATAERMEDEGIDVVICYQTEPATDLQELAVLDEMIVPVCSRDYLREMQRANGPPPITRLHDDVPWLGGPREFEWDAWTTQNASWACQVVSERHYNLAHLAYHAALCGQGVAMGRVVLVNRLLNRGELIPATSLMPVRGASYRILTHRPGAAASPVRRFAAWLRTEMEKSQQQTLTTISET